MADNYDESISTDLVYNYIFYNEIITDYFRAFLEEEGILD